MAVSGLSCGMQPPALGAQSLSHWTTREVAKICTSDYLCLQKDCHWLYFPWYVFHPKDIYLFCNWKCIPLNLPHLFPSCSHWFPLCQPPDCSLYLWLFLFCLFICFVFYIPLICKIIQYVSVLFHLYNIFLVHPYCHKCKISFFLWLGNIPLHIYKHIHIHVYVFQLLSCLTLWNTMDCSMPGFPVLLDLLESAQLISIVSMMLSNNLILSSHLSHNLSIHLSVSSWLLWIMLPWT